MTTTKVEQRDNGRWFVIYDGTNVSGRGHVAKYKATAQALALNPLHDALEYDNAQH